jgi:hypothetical protein
MPASHIVTTVADIAEVVGSTPTQSIFINLVIIYGIELSSILTIVGQYCQQCPWQIR